ncbi:hypothetical protein SRABI89_03986 [Pseudomonas koreensis]|nr:hypothetical protein SRABI89_03986 [Pseudomonas koreensis]
MSLEQNYTAMSRGVYYVARSNEIRGLMPRRTQFVVLKSTYWYKNWYEILSPPKGKVAGSNPAWDTI